VAGQLELGERRLQTRRLIDARGGRTITAPLLKMILKCGSSLPSNQDQPPAALLELLQCLDRLVVDQPIISDGTLVICSERQAWPAIIIFSDDCDGYRGTLSAL
jgi:hypothetical protein